MIKNRTELAKYFAELGFTNGVEIGTAQGRYAEILHNSIPNLTLLCVDNYGNRWEPLYEEAKTRLTPYGIPIWHMRSLEGAEAIKEESQDFVFIDADHSYEMVRDDIEAWTPKVRIGGIVSGHDYYLTRHGNLGVIQAVNEYADKHGYELQFTRWDLEADNKDDRQPCWYFRKDK